MSKLRNNWKNTVILIPAYNEEACIGALLSEIHDELGKVDVVVINDGSTDETAAVVRASGARLLDLPCNLGVGQAVQAGFIYAYERGYDRAVRLDADGQHPPSAISVLLEKMDESGVDLVLGSRFLGGKSHRNTLVRYWGVRALGLILSVVCRKKVTDPTSGLQALNRSVLKLFASSYPVDYPEPEAIALLRRQGYDFAEVGVDFRERMAGESSISEWGTLYYVVKVFLALLVDRARPVDPRLAKFRVEAAK